MTKQKPATWTVGTTLKDGFTVVRVRQFFAVLKRTKDGQKAEWAVEFIDGKRQTAKSSGEAGEKGRAYRDAQQAKGVTVERTRKAPAKKASAAKAPAKKASAAKKAPAKARANGRGTAAKKAPAKKASAARSGSAKRTVTARTRKARA